MRIEIPDYLPLSYLNQFAYCRRRFWLMFVHGEMAVNAALLDGTYRHRHADKPGHDWHEDGRVYRSVWVWSDTLRIAGLADFVQTRHDDDLVPLEHKRGRIGKWLSDHVQLCAQALCLEERTGRRIQQGEIFYWANRRREVVTIDGALREVTKSIIKDAFDALEQNVLPDPIDNPIKCRDCSLKSICLPDEVQQLRGTDP